MVYSVREFKKILKKNGYHYVRSKGSHSVWNNGIKSLTITEKKINRMIIQRLIKEYNLEV